MEYVMNSCYGGFGLSEEAFVWLKKNKNWKEATDSKEEGDFHSYDFGPKKRYYSQKQDSLYFRCNKDVVECVKTLGSEKASGRYSSLEIVDCPLGPDENLEIDEYDGIETLQTIPSRW